MQDYSKVNTKAWLSRIKEVSILFTLRQIFLDTTQQKNNNDLEYKPTFIRNLPSCRYPTATICILELICISRDYSKANVLVNSWHPLTDILMTNIH